MPGSKDPGFLLGGFMARRDPAQGFGFVYDLTYIRLALKDPASYPINTGSAQPKSSYNFNKDPKPKKGKRNAR
jgi:hypothetical protein